MESETTPSEKNPKIRILEVPDYYGEALESKNKNH